MTAAGATLTLDSTETQADSDLAAGTLAVTIGSATRLSCELPVVASTVTQRRFSVAVTSEDAVTVNWFGPTIGSRSASTFFFASPLRVRVGDQHEPDMEVSLVSSERTSHSLVARSDDRVQPVAIREASSGYLSIRRMS